MQQVLLDGTTVMSASRLLAGDDPPNALNFWSLSLLIESLILHETIIALDTSDSGQLVERGGVFGEPLRVEHRSVRDLVDHYIEMEFPEFAGLHQLSGDRLKHFQIYGSP